MYLISVYFDEQTNRRIQYYINQIAKKTGNTFLLEHQVPPHLTITAFEAYQQETAVSVFENSVKELRQGELEWVSVGAFFPYVLYLAPVLNQSLQQYIETVHRQAVAAPGVKTQRFYEPFHWFPHLTLGKTLTKEQMQVAFAWMQEQFSPFTGHITEIGLAKTNPHRDLMRTIL